MNYLTRDNVCNGESFRCISFVISYISLKKHIFYTQIITVIKASEGQKDKLTTLSLHGYYINKLTPS